MVMLHSVNCLFYLGGDQYPDYSSSTYNEQNQLLTLMFLDWMTRCGHNSQLRSNFRNSHSERSQERDWADKEWQFRNSMGTR